MGPPPSRTGFPQRPRENDKPVVSLRRLEFEEPSQHLIQIDRLDLLETHRNRSAADGAPVFGDAESFQYLVWHEFSHSFVNPVVDAFGEQIDAYAELFEPLRSGMSPQGYGKGRTCVYEQMVRAATCRFAAREAGLTEGRKAVEYETSRQFVYIGALCAKLEQYENHGSHERAPAVGRSLPALVLRRGLGCGGFAIGSR